MPPEHEDPLPGPCSLAIDELIELHQAQVDLLRIQLRRDFSRTCSSRVDDAVQVAALAVVEHPVRFQEAWADGGDHAVGQLLLTVAWRHLRGEHRRRAYRNEVTSLDLAEVEPCLGASADAPQELSVDLQLHIDALIAQACAVTPECAAARVIEALSEKVRTGDPDTDVALRTGVRREYLNRAKRQLRQILREEVGVG